MNADVFISFASQDSKTARTICTAIENRGFRCWISSRDIQPGENFQSAIVRAIRSAKVLLLVFTANSNRSDEMTKELALASQQKLMVVPLRVENVSPSDAFAYEFATRQWIDLFSDWEQAINQLSTRLSAALADDRTHMETIVLGKPSLQDPASIARQRAARTRLWAIGAAVVLVSVAALAIPRLRGRHPAPLAAAQLQAPATGSTAHPAAAPTAGSISPAGDAAASSAATLQTSAPAAGAASSAPDAGPSVLARAENAAKNATAEVTSVLKPHRAARKTTPANSNVPY